MIGLLKGLGLKLRGRHRDGFWSPAEQSKAVRGTVIDKDFDVPIRDGEFITGHSGPFPTDLPVICNLRDPRNIMVCQWKRHRSSRTEPFAKWLTSTRSLAQVMTIPRHWEWRGSNVLRVWFETVDQESVQREIADFCGVEWMATNSYGHGRAWSGRPSDWTVEFDSECTALWDRLWRDVMGQSWDGWWHRNGRNN